MKTSKIKVFYLFLEINCYHKFVNLDNLKFSLFLPKFGLSLIDTSPKEFFYLEVNSVKLMLKKVHDYFDVRLSVLDFQVLHFLKKL